jgi:hypothetical protein
MDNRLIVSPVMISLCCDGVHRTSPLPPLIYIPPCSRMKVPLESQCLERQPISPSSVRLEAPDTPRLPLFIPSKVRQWLSWSCFYIPLSSLPRGPPKVSSIIICIAPPHLCEADCSFWILVSSGIRYFIHLLLHIYSDVGGVGVRDSNPDYAAVNEWSPIHFYS